MIAQIWITQVIFAIALAAPGHEFLPEKYLKPRDFNYHPYTDVGISAALKKPASASILESNPFEILEKLRMKEIQEHANENFIYYPTVPQQKPEKISKKIDTNHLPKNYAFTYTVKDLLSGDDFSHSQAHNGKATKGEYRVKLPDGRTQIVSYTADHKGYRADVQYEEKATDNMVYVQPQPLLQRVTAFPIKLPEALQKVYQRYQNDVGGKYRLVPLQSASAANPTVSSKLEDADYASNQVTVSPVEVQTAEGGVLKLLVSHGNPVSSPHYYKPIYLTPYVAPQNDQPEYESNASPVRYVASTMAPQVNYVTSTSSYPADAKHAYHTYPVVSSTVAPTHAVIVTPKPLHRKSEIKTLKQSPYLYKLVN